MPCDQIGLTTSKS
uniref:Uncharacterized protein n=1 Tax=Arundo donax TaxID=35708 RepID=A0A0A9ASQ6_ARUDO